MSKIRVHEMAKELNKSSKDVIYALKGHGIDVESHMSAISTEDAERVRRFFAQQSAAKSEAKAAPVKREHGSERQHVENAGKPTGTPQDGQRQSNQRQGQNQERRPYSNQSGERRPYSNQGGSERRPYNNQGGGERRPYNNQGGERRPYSNQGGEKRPYSNQGGERRPYSNQGGERRPYSNQGGERRPYSNQGGGERRPYNDQSGERRPYSNQGGGERRPYNDQSGGERRPYSNQGGEKRPYNNQGGEKRPYNNQSGERRPYSNQSGGERRPYSNQGGGERRPYSNQGGGERRPYSSNQGGGERRPYSNQGGGERRPYSNQGGERRPYSNQNQGNRSYSNQSRPSSATGGARNYSNQRGHDRDDKFNLDSAISKEVVVAKDTTRENRRNFTNKDKAPKGKDNQRKNVRNQNRNNSLSRKPTLAPPEPKQKPVIEKVTNIIVPATITLKELGDKMKVPNAQIVKKLFLAGKMVSLNSEITYDEAEEIALEYDVLCEPEVVIDVIEELLKEDDENENELVPRPPVVCVMGHVDHGKTSILDAIRKSNVTTGEAGGITQHIGAYVVEVGGQKITFLDTPGHEAFTSMRLRGAKSTDIAILVVAADDGVMPQTIEAINHAKAAGIEIIVAINKIDKPGANIDRVKQELTEYELVSEEWGGKTIMVPVSAHTREGLSDLLDMILLTAELLELKANPNRNARGLIIEAELHKQKGPVATVLVQKGTLHVGDVLAVGPVHGKVRAMTDDKGFRVKVAGPSTPVEILGLDEAPQAGDIFMATDTEKEARAINSTFVATKREKMLGDTKAKLSLDGLFDQIQAGQIKELNIIVKADVQGSVEAVKQSLIKLSNEEVAVKVIHGGVGAINESDVILASASNAIIIGFNVRPDNGAKSVAEQEKVDLRLYRIIYNAIEDVEAAMKGMLDPTFEEKTLGHAEVRQTYKVSGVGTIIGGYVLDGKFVRNCKVRLLRDNVVIHDGELASLKRFKDDVKEVAAGYECGMSFEKFNDIKVGDQIEAYIMEEVPR